MTHAAALVAVHAAVALFGFAGLFGKWLTLSPVAIVLGRTTVAAIALGILLLRARERAPFDVRLIANGVVLALHWLSFFAAIQESTVAVGLLGFASFPLFTLLAERIFLARRLRPRDGVTALLVTAGLALLVPELSLSNPVVLGLGWGLVSGFTFALLVVMNRRWTGTRTATDIAFWQNALAALVLVPFAWAADYAIGPIGGREIMLIIVLGLACTALAHTLFISGLAVVTAHTASVIAALEPVYGIALALVFLGEVPTPRTIAGGALIVAAAVIATRRSHLATVAAREPTREAHL
ncbi:MAG TPA: DMT family transporter [Gemmatimonadaceae bacterium]|nr:DMT family transporter [Gemmatimonadaceae bacterium]